MALNIPEDLLRSAGMSADELKHEIAVMLFASDRLRLGKAAAFADMSRIAFQRLLASRHITQHYDIAEFQRDLETLGTLESQER